MEFKHSSDVIKQLTFALALRYALCFGICQTPIGKSLLASCFVLICQKFYWIAVKNVLFLLGLRVVYQ